MEKLCGFSDFLLYSTPNLLVHSKITTLYINKYYEKLVPYSDTGNLTTGNVTSYYYHGGKLVAMKQGSANVSYVHQDSLSGTSVMSDSSGALISSISYAPFGSTRSGSVPTDIKFTGQRLDATGLYYYGARYYDPQIGRFISPDSVGQHLANPQTLNRYSYVVNNPLRYTDPTGHVYVEDEWGNVFWDPTEPGQTYDPNSNPAFQDWSRSQPDNRVNEPILDKAISFDGDFIVTSGMLPGDSGWARTVNILEAIASLGSSFLGGPSTLKSAPTNVSVVGSITVTHTDSADSSVSVFSTSSPSLPMRADLTWTLTDGSRNTMSMDPFVQTGLSIRAIGFQQDWQTQGSGVPSFNDPQLQSMSVVLTPLTSRIPRGEASRLPFTRPGSLTVKLK